MSVHVSSIITMSTATLPLFERLHTPPDKNATRKVNLNEKIARHDDDRLLERTDRLHRRLGWSGRLHEPSHRCV